MENEQGYVHLVIPGTMPEVFVWEQEFEEQSVSVVLMAMLALLMKSVVDVVVDVAVIATKRN